MSNVNNQQLKKSHKVRNWTFGILAVFVAFGIIGSFIPDEETGSSDATSSQVQEQPSKDGKAKKSDKPAKHKKANKKAEKSEPVEDEPTEEPESEPTEEPVEEEPTITTEQENALASGQSYIDTMPFSHQGLIQQLKFEGFGQADAQYAADNVSVDWNAEAAESAEGYQQTMPMSRQGMIDQLVFEGFTPEQAAYGADSVGL